MIGWVGVRDPRLRNKALWQGPRLLFVVSALFLAFVSASGWSTTGLTVALVIFGVSTLIFVGRQIIRGHAPDGRLERLGAVLCAAGAVVLLTYVVVKIDFLPLCGSVLLVLGLGWLIEAWRGARPRHRDGASLLLWGLVLLGIAVLVLAVTAGLLFRGTLDPSLALLVVAGFALLVVLPVSVNLLSERGLRWVQSRPSPRRFTTDRLPAVPYLACVVVAAAIAFAAYLWSTDWVLTAAALAIAVGLVVAVVSNTHADVAMVLAVVSLVAAAPLQEVAPDALTPVAGADTVVALGDSYMSGEGASVYYAGTNDPGANQCRRSPTSYAAELVVQNHRFDRLVFLGCSGARTYNVVATVDDPGHARAQHGESGTQVDQLKKLMESNIGFRPSLILVGIGGNDAGFATIAETCLAPGDCSSQRSLFERNLPSVRRALVASYSSIRKAAPGVPVLAVPYPQPIADTRRCNGVALARPERDFIHSFVDQLDRTVEAAAAQAGISYAADMKDSLAAKRIQLCATSKSNAGINFVDLRSVNGLAAQRFNPARWLHNSLHPNARGHDAMLETLESWIRSHPSIAAAGRVPEEVSEGAVTEPDPPCSMTVTDNQSCQRLALEWELGELKSRVWWAVGSGLLGLLLLWTVSVVILGRVRALRGTGGSRL